MRTPQLDAALDQFGALLETATQQDAATPTPCAEWDLAALVDHLLSDLGQFTVMAEGGQPDFAAAPPHVDRADWLAAFAEGRERLDAAWTHAEDGSPDMQVCEFAVHTWDLARAVGRTDVLDDALAEHALGFLQGMLTPERRGDSFGPEQSAPDGAPPYDRLAAFAGREV
jgi:uncharacterized protein (TIGR03083 family)